MTDTKTNVAGEDTLLLDAPITPKRNRGAALAHSNQKEDDPFDENYSESGTNNQPPADPAVIHDATVVITGFYTRDLSDYDSITRVRYNDQAWNMLCKGTWLVMEELHVALTDPEVNIQSYLPRAAWDHYLTDAYLRSILVKLRAKARSIQYDGKSFDGSDVNRILNIIRVIERFVGDLDRPETAWTKTNLVGLHRVVKGHRTPMAAEDEITEYTEGTGNKIAREKAEEDKRAGSLVFYDRFDHFLAHFYDMASNPEQRKFYITSLERRANRTEAEERS